MFGLSQIKSINDNAARKSKDATRRSKGQKPADTASDIERKASASRPVKFKTLDGVRPGSQFQVGNE